MLMKVEKGIREGMCNAVFRYAKANNKYMKNYNINTESSYLEYLDANSLYGWAMSQKLPVDGFKWIEEDNLSKLDEKSIKNYNVEEDVEYPKNIHKLHNDLPFLPERMKINKCSKLICTMQNKEN